MVQTVDDDRLDETFAALANATRRAILARLASGEASVNELAEPFAMTLPAISKHIKVLEHAGLIVRSQRAQYRPCTLDTGPLEAVASWADQYRPIWDARFDRLQNYVVNELATAKPASPNSSSTKPSSNKPSSTKPSSTKPSSTKPSSTKPSSIKPPATKGRRYE